MAEQRLSIKQMSKSVFKIALVTDYWLWHIFTTVLIRRAEYNATESCFSFMGKPFEIAVVLPLPTYNPRATLFKNG